MTSSMSVAYEAMVRLASDLDSFGATLNVFAGDVQAAVASARNAEGNAESPVSAQLGLFEHRWSREMQLTAEDLTALATTVRAVATGFRDLDDRSAQSLEAN